MTEAAHSVTEEPREYDVADVHPLRYAANDWRARTNEVMPNSKALIATGDRVVSCAETLASHYLRLLSAYDSQAEEAQDMRLAYEQAQHQLDQARDELQRFNDWLALADDDELEQGNAHYLAGLVRYEHDREHHQPWAVCSREVCRAAGRLVP